MLDCGVKIQVLTNDTKTKLMVEMKVLECSKMSEESIGDRQQDDDSDTPIIAENQGFLKTKLGSATMDKVKASFSSWKTPFQ